jgi:hypothetical protein
MSRGSATANWTVAGALFVRPSLTKKVKRSVPLNA